MGDEETPNSPLPPRPRQPWTVRNVAHRDKVLFAREQRREPTEMEDLLWRRLRGAPFGCRFRRQHPIGDFVLDFYCAQIKLALEVDGPVHLARSAYDAWRDAQLERLGIRVWRIAGEEVALRMPEIMGVIRQAGKEMREEARNRRSESE